MVSMSGVTIFVVNNTADVVQNNYNSGNIVDTIASSVSYTLPGFVTTLVLTGTANVNGTALVGDNSLVGNAGNDIL
jgi:hypothetical protein